MTKQKRKEKGKMEKIIKESVTLQETVDFLNELLVTDPTAISSLFSVRLACNKKLADHETVQVGALSKSFFQVGMIGILNGLFGIDKYGWGHISADYEDGKIIRFRALTEEDVAGYVNEK